jgi:hypothetical protein
MLRIRVDTTPRETTLRLEGRLAGPWVDELARCWAGVCAAKHTGSIHVDLDGVTFIGAAGKVLLREMHDGGGVLLAHDCATRAIVDEITHRDPT